MSNLAISTIGLGKKYRIGSHDRYETLRETLSEGLSRLSFRRTRKSGAADSIWALKDLCFEIRHGDVVGIIGRNGAGKSTLLKILSRITHPSEGRAEIRGRVGALLEVGTGFHLELTGRENIFLNGTILGMRKAEIVAKFDEIVAFSEIEQFLDTPVKHYSSGMHVRLAFAIAAHLEPEILIADEVLAVGDLAFQKKCLGKMSEVSREGRTVLFVSHNMAAVESLCRNGMVLDRGKLAFSGPVRAAARYYYDSLSVSTNPTTHVFDLSDAAQRQSDIGKLLKCIELYTDEDLPLNAGVRMGDRLKVKVHFDLPSVTTGFNVGIGFDNVFGQRILTAHSFYAAERPQITRAGRQVFVCDIPEFTLMPGTYTIRLWLDIASTEADRIDNAAPVTVIESDYYRTGRVPKTGTMVLRQNWYLEGRGADRASAGEVAQDAALGECCIANGPEVL
jgi:lipopolysaccharide transport system ATP-binding protein